MSTSLLISRPAAVSTDVSCNGSDNVANHLLTTQQVTGPTQPQSIQPSMSPTSAFPPPLSFFDLTRPGTKYLDEDCLAHPATRNQTWPASFQNGLPTPPFYKAMTEYRSYPVPSNGASTQYQYDPRYHQHEVPAGRAYGLENGRSQHLVHQDQSQKHHRAASSKDIMFETRPPGQNMIASSFQIPESVNSSKGSIAEFAAEITCLFWFESEATIRYAEELSDTAYVERGLVQDATPSIGFRKWVTTILTTTLVGKNVILLALLFIYRLKKLNPGVSGKRGSEFRLLTIALMLGNKFLDDNTYTNKTWAEVSGISVSEIHIMEVEFLSNMRYALFVTEKEWAEWKLKLGKFGAFFEASSKLPTSNGAITPTLQSFPHKLPSPPASHHSVSPYTLPQTITPAYTPLPNPFSNIPPLPRSPLRQQQNVNVGQPSRKRSLDPSSEQPVAKRMYQPGVAPSQPQMAPISQSVAYTPSGLANLMSDSNSSSSSPASFGTVNPQGLPRLPMPTVQNSTSHVNQPSMSQLAPLQLPANRAMSTVYPPASGSWSQQSTPVSAGPSTKTTLYANPVHGLGENSRNGSTSASTHVSPTAAAFSSAVSPGNRLSPSFFLTNRSSPYRPVRNVNTLLYPPPSASLNNPSRNLTHEQIYYQPLSKAATERRAGVVPYLHHDAWAQGYTATPPVPPHYEFRV